MDISKERSKISDVADRLIDIRSNSKEVKDYLLLTREVRYLMKLMDKNPVDSIIYQMRLQYKSILEEKIATLLKDSQVIKYVETFNEISEILKFTSCSMKELKSKHPELHAWIALNKKRAYYQTKFFEDPSNYRYKEQIEAAEKAISDFRILYQSSVDEWEEYYKLMQSISSVK